LISTKEQALQGRLDFVTKEMKASDIFMGMEQRIDQPQEKITANEDLI
jgi:hypothetical protein